MSRHRMDPGDAAWLHMDRPTNRMIVHSVMWFDEPMDWGELRTVIHDRLLDRFPHFSQRVVELPGLAWWEDVAVDLDRHLVRATLPAPGDQAALERYVSGILHRRFDLNRPLWELHLVDGFRGGGSAIVARIHHCIADGIALSRVLLSLADGAEPPEAAGTGRERSGGLVPFVIDRSEAALGELLQLAGAATGEIRHPSRAVDTARHGTAGALTLARLLLMGRDTDTVLRGPAGLRKQVAWSAPLSLDRVRTAARARGVTVNDLVVTALTGAVRQYLIREGDNPTDVRVMMPVNLRQLDQPLGAELGNRFGLAYLRLPVSAADPDERLAVVHERACAIKDSSEGRVTFGVLDLIGRTPYDVEQSLVDVFADKATAVVTNVPGPRRGVFLAGRRVAGTIAWPPESGNLALGVSIISYDGGLVIGVLSDVQLVRDPRFLLDTVLSELDSLLAGDRCTV